MSLVRSAFPNWDFSWRYNTKNTGQSCFNELFPLTSCDWIIRLILISWHMEYFWHSLDLFGLLLKFFLVLSPEGIHTEFTWFPESRSWSLWRSWSHSGIFVFSSRRDRCMWSWNLTDDSYFWTVRLKLRLRDVGDEFWTSGPQSFWAKCPCVASLTVTSRGRWLLSSMLF